MTGGKTTDLQVLIKADAATIALKAEKSGHIRVNASSLREPGCILPGEQLVVRWEYGQVVVARQPGPPIKTPADSLADAGY